MSGRIVCPACGDHVSEGQREEHMAHFPGCVVAALRAQRDELAEAGRSLLEESGAFQGLPSSDSPAEAKMRSALSRVEGGGSC